MARLINRLSARHVELARVPGRYGDGAGLNLIVGPNRRQQWVFRYRFRGGRRDMGLGGAGKGGVSLAHARALAADARKQIAEGRDPLRQRAQDQAAVQAARAASLVPTFGDIADEVVTALAPSGAQRRMRQLPLRASSRPPQIAAAAQHEDRV